MIPISCIWPDGIFKVGNKFSQTFRFSDINYQVASREDKESMFLTYSELLNSLDSGAITKITINNRRMNKADFEDSILMPLRGDRLDEYRKEYNQMLLDKATGANGIMQEKYITVSAAKKDIEEARAYFARIGADLISHFAALGSKCAAMNATERLRVLHDFYRAGEEVDFHFDARDMMKKGHDFRDYICPDSIEKNSDYFKLGEKYGARAFSQRLRFVYQGQHGVRADRPQPKHDALYRHHPDPHRRGGARGGKPSARRGDEHHELAAPPKSEQQLFRCRAV